MELYVLASQRLYSNSEDVYPHHSHSTLASNEAGMLAASPLAELREHR